MRSSSKRPIRKQLYTAIATALALGASVVMSSHAQESEPDLVPVLDVDIVLLETPGTGETLPGDIPEVGELPEEVEPLPTLPEGIALDNDGNAYPEGGPAGLYNAIVDKQQKLGMTGIYDLEGNLVEVIYEAGNHGQQNALSRLRANLERKLNKHGQLDDVTEAPEIEPLPEDLVELAEIPEALEEVPVDELEPVAALPEGVALDKDGNAYPEGGPAGLYKAITDKQQKVGMEGVYDGDGSLVDVTYEGGNTGQQNALSRLRANLERKLKKLGLFDETPEVPDTGDLVDAPVVEELAISAELGISTQSVKVSKAKVEKSQKPEKAAKLEKVTKIERVEKTTKPVRLERVERPQKPTKVTRVERPQRPEKIARVEKPQRPEKIARVEKPQRPEKPQKPVKPERPGRS
jgi:hypothetical protein